jgi:hypothetical protein
VNTAFVRAEHMLEEVSMRTEIEQKKFELVLDISERRGVEGVKILHFVIEECLRFYQKKIRDRFLRRNITIA